MQFQWVYIATLLMSNLVFAGQSVQGHVYSGLYGHGTLGSNTGSTGYNFPGGYVNGYSPSSSLAASTTNLASPYYSSACGTCGAKIPIIHYYPVAPYDSPKQDQKVYKYSLK